MYIKRKIGSGAIYFFVDNYFYFSLAKSKHIGYNKTNKERKYKR